MNELQLVQFMNTITDNTNIIIDLRIDKNDDIVKVINCNRTKYPVSLNSCYIRKIYAITKDIIKIDVYFVKKRR